MTTQSDIWIGIDLGTSSVKAMAVNADGTEAAIQTRAYPLSSPRAGWVEQSPEQWWDATAEAIRAVVEQCPGATIGGFGLSGQMHGLVALDDQGQVLRPAILWNDNRNAAQVEQILDAVGGSEALLAMTGNPMLAGFTAGKILWFKQHEPELFARTARILNPKDYIRFRLTGDQVTDVSDASGTGLFDVEHRVWSDELLALLDIDRTLLPDAVESTAITGTVHAEGAARTGLPEGLPVVGGGGDAVLQTTSMAIIDEGQLGVTIGTAGIVASAADHFPGNPGSALQVSCGNAPGKWHIMGVALTTGGVLPWLAEALAPLTGGTADVARVADLASDSVPGANGLQFLPYLVGERAPHRDPDARAALCQIDVRHTINDIARAAIEGAVLNIRQVRDLFVTMGLAVDDVRISGGATGHPIWRDTLVDVLGCDCWTVSGGEQGAAYGAALLAGVGTGQWDSLEDALTRVGTRDRLRPDPERAALYDQVFEQFTSLYQPLADARRAVEDAEAEGAASS